MKLTFPPAAYMINFLCDSLLDSICSWNCIIKWSECQSFCIILYL